MHLTSYPTHIHFIPSESTLPFLSYSNFNILPWKSKVKVMGEVKVRSHTVSLTFYRLTSLSFQVNQPSHSWDTTFSKFDRENPRSRSWKRWTLKVTSWVEDSIDSHPFRSMSIGHPIHKIWLKNLTLKIQGEGHGWGERWKSQHESNILSTHIPLIPCQSAIPFLIWLFKNLNLKIKGQGPGWGQSWKSQSGCNILSTHIPFVPCQSAQPFLRYSIFKIWPWKSKVKVMGEENVERHNMGPTYYRLTSLSFHVNRPSHPWYDFFKIWLWKSKSRSWLRSKFKVTKWM